MTDFDDRYYINQVIGGDTNAFVHLVRRYQKMVYTLVCKIVNDRDDAEDITQDIFIKVFESLRSFRKESEFSTWLYRIAYNTTINKVRKSKKIFISINEILPGVPTEDISPDIDSLSTEEQLRYLDIVMKKLKPDEAMLISLFYLDNLSILQIADISGLSQSNVKVKLHRIRKFMNFEINKLIANG